MAKGSGSSRMAAPRGAPERDMYNESRRLRTEALAVAESFKGTPKRFEIDGINGTFELSKADVKTIVSKNTSDNRFNAIKNAMAKDVEGYLKKASYVGWREVVEGKHPETEYFEYYDRTLMVKTYLCVRVLKGSGLKKPYAIIDEKTFNEEIGTVHKEKR